MLTRPHYLHTANILIDTTFRAKLADFGLSQKTKLHGYVGTPYYMAPELLNLKGNTAASDVYAMVRAGLGLIGRTWEYLQTA